MAWPQTTKLDFIVLALPRSGTAWLANWLTTYGSLCLHDPFSAGLPETWPIDQRPRGIACTVSALMPRWLSEHACPIAIIERDYRACDASMEKLGLPGTEAFRDAVAAMPGERFAFDALFEDEAVARALWGYLLPKLPFDPIRYRMLRDLQVQRHPRIGYLPDTANALIEHGLLEGKL